MKKSDIEELAYLIKNSKEKPIVFLGAGASVTGNIPLANTIVNDILEKYKENPRVKKDIEKNYKSLMDCLLPDERNNLLKGYIENAKINVTHIYLAQFMKNDLIDYVLTVNFDNLMLRALALYNMYPPTYDMAILKDITTTTFPIKSVIYLHGQHHGLWLLNTEEELKKVNEVIPPILNSIKDRPWIFLGYSANDPIFNHLTKLGRFDKGLYWVTRKEKNISEEVRKNLLAKENTNCFLIDGYDSDSFMLELNSKLQQEQPEIFEKPFSFLKNSLNNIVDIQDEEHFKGIKQRLEIIKSQVDDSIKDYENKETDKNIIKEIIDIRLKEDFNEEEISKLFNKVKISGNQKIKDSLSDLYNHWGNVIYNLATQKQTKEIYENALDKYEKALELDPNDENIFYNLGNALSDLGKLKNDEQLYKKAFEKYKKASKLNPDEVKIFSNWGISLFELAKNKNNEELFKESFEKLTKAFEFDGKHYNLACYYAVKKDKENALITLEKVLENDEVSINHIMKDDDWDNFREDIDFKNLINKYSKKEQ